MAAAVFAQRPRRAERVPRCKSSPSRRMPRNRRRASWWSWGLNVNFIGDQYHSVRDAGAIEDDILEAAAKLGLPTPRYIRPRGGAEFTRG